MCGETGTSELIKAPNDHLPDPNKGVSTNLLSIRTFTSLHVSNLNCERKIKFSTQNASLESKFADPDHGNGPVKVDFTCAFRTGGVFLSCVQQGNDSTAAFICFLIQILLMNKTDLFQEKIRHSGRHLRLYFSEYQGNFFFSPARNAHVQFKHPPPQEMMGTWTPQLISSQPCSRRAAPTDPCTTTTPRQRTRPAFGWSSTWSWIRLSKTAWHPSSCCNCIVLVFI